MEKNLTKGDIMAQAVVTSATAMCSFGTTPSILNATNNVTTLFGGKPVCTIADAAPMVNVPPCGLCTSLANPAVAAATAAAMGVLTPQPCIPMIVGSWIPSQTKVLIGGQPALTLGSSCMCAYGGNISIVNPGQVTVNAG